MNMRTNSTMNPSLAPLISALDKAIWEDTHIAIIMKIQKRGFARLLVVNMFLRRVPPDLSKEINKLVPILSLFIPCTRNPLNTAKECGSSKYSACISEAVPLKIGPNPINKFPIL